MIIQFGSEVTLIEEATSEQATVKLPIQVLGTKYQEKIEVNNASYKREGSFHLWSNNHLTFGFAEAKISPEDYSLSAKKLYQQLFTLIEGCYLYRAWNFIPEINFGKGDSENYKKFCEGRSLAFHKAFGDSEHNYMPAGTCVGIQGTSILIYFLAGKNSPDHYENPNQVPAYRYPRKYGPKSPSFARASSVHIDHSHYRFISGTSAVLGHQSVGRGNLREQLNITCQNLETIYQQTQKEEDIGNNAKSLLSGKVYLRHADDYTEARNYIEELFPHTKGNLIYLLSDICREELLVEIELTYTKPF